MKKALLFVLVLFSCVCSQGLEPSIPFNPNYQQTYQADNQNGTAYRQNQIPYGSFPVNGNDYSSQQHTPQSSFYQDNQDSDVYGDGDERDPQNTATYYAGLDYEERYRCPPNWIRYRESCYRFTKSPDRPRNEARKICQAYEADLASVNTPEEHGFIITNLMRLDPQKGSWYVGAHQQSPGYWSNEVDGSQLTGLENAFFDDRKLTYTSYNLLPRDYLVYRFSHEDGRWGLAAVEGTQYFHFICEGQTQRLHYLIEEQRSFTYGLDTFDPERIPRGPYFTKEPTDTIYDPLRNKHVQLTCIAAGYPAPTYKWFREDYQVDSPIFTEINPLSDPRFIISGGSLMIYNPDADKDNAKYHCTATNKYGTIRSESVRLSFGFIREFNQKRPVESGKQYWGMVMYCDPPSYYPSVNFLWARNYFPNLVEEDKRVFVSYDGGLYFSALETIDRGNYSCNVMSQVSEAGRNGPFFPLLVYPHSDYQHLKFPNNFPKLFPEAPIVGQEVRFECISFGYPVPSYNWTRKNGDMPKKAYLSNFNRVLTIPSVGVEDEGEYICDVRNDRAHISNNVYLKVQAEPNFTIPLTDKHMDNKGNLHWSCEAFGIPDVNYTWWKNSEKLTMDTLETEDRDRYVIQDNVLIIKYLDPTRDPGMYQCEAKNQLKAKYSTGQLRVLSLKPSFKKHPLESETYGSEGGNVTLRCNPEAAPKMETYLNKMLYGTEERSSPSRAEIKKNLYEDEDIPPYITESGAKLMATSAVSLVNRYCSVLPHDLYTKILPMVIQERVKDTRTLVTIIMPIACSVKEPVQGLPMYTVKDAKRSAALNVCIKLHKAGELNYETLLPVLKGNIDFSTADVSSCFPNWRAEDQVEDVGPPGTKKRVRKHPVHYPKCLNGPKTVKDGMKCYVHVIKLETAFKEPTDTREKALYDMLQNKEGYGLVTFQPLPVLCSFPMFLTVGEVRTTLEVNYSAISLDMDQLELIKQFHFFIFDQVLEVAKKFLVFDGRVNNLYVVPLKYDNGYNIDWNVMQTYKEIPPCNEPTRQERMSLRVTKDMYDNCVVTPWYRGSLHPDRYIVSRVLEYLTPYSEFEGGTFDTFADYYANKYNLEILGSKDQPLLEVRNISSRMNCLLPRAATISGLTDKQRRLASLAHGDHKPREFAELFVPEYCVRGEYPAHRWYKAIILPSILHRITMLLIADELRAQILLDTKKKRFDLQRGQCWLPIEVDLAVVKKSLLSNLDEPTPINSVDRINNPMDETAQKPPKIVSMKESVYQLETKKLSKKYPWDESTEPIDIDRNLSHVTVMDIECYDKFLMAPLRALEPMSLVRSPPRVAPPSAPTAILPPPLLYKDTISILSIEPSPSGPQLRQLLSALTMINSHDTFNLERAETLGDSFLKYAASLYLFHKFPKLDEGQLTNIKGRLIGNRNLYYAGERVGLAGRMKVEPFSPRSDFLVPGFLAPKELVTFIEQRRIRPTFLIGVQFPLEDALSGNLSSESRAHLQEKFKDSDLAEDEPFGKAQNAMQKYVSSQAVSDKSVADCVEALIGTYLLSGGIHDAAGVLEWLNIIPPQDKLTNFLNKKVDTVVSKGTATITNVEWLLNHCRKDIENILGYKFHDPSLLLEALSHGSYIRNRLTPSYERLEFLGDAILDFLITAYIYENCGKLSPGELTDLRSALVNNVTFASYVVRLGLHKFFCTQFNGVLESAIKTFVDHQEQHQHVMLEDVLYLIEEEDCNIAQYIDVPKVLSDIFESLTGAMYLDSGGDLSLVWKVIYKIMHKEIHAFSMKVPKQPVRVLLEMIHACPSFGKSRATQSTVPKILVPVTFTRAGQRQTVYGAGGNKAQAKRAAAKLALKLLAA